MIVKAKGNFKNSVFGADYFLLYWPELESTGIEIQLIKNYYYVIVDGKIASGSAFFSQRELEECLEVL